MRHIKLPLGEAETTRTSDEAGPLVTHRRAFVIGAALVGGSLLVGCGPADIMAAGAPHRDFGAFGPFLKIAADGSVTVLNKHQEMGQGNHVGLATLVAEELDADWDKVSVEHSPADAKIYKNNLMGVQGTGGSTAIADSWLQYRKVGASARAMFVGAAAETWKVPASEIKVSDGVVSHASGKRATFAELLPAAARQTPPKEPALKDPKDFRLIGSEKPRRKDSRAKSTGKARYTQDVNLPGQVTALVAHSPRFGGKVKSFDATEARKVKGVQDVFAIPTGVAVVADGFWAAKKGRDALKVEWDFSKAESRSSDEMRAQYAAIARGEATPADDKWGKVTTKGDAGPLDDAADVLHAVYDFPFLAHATMEPMNCVAQVDGGRCKLTYGAQGQSLDQLNVALHVGALPGSVEIETLFAGGSFGRRSSWDSDYVVEAASIAKKVGGFKPVKLVWTREDDMLGAHYRPMAHHDVRVRIGKDGYPTAWRHRIVIQSFTKGTMLESQMVKNGVDASTVEGVMGSPYLEATPVVDVQVFNPRSPITTLWWRSVGATHAAPAMEHTIDQLARRAGVDPVDYRRELYRRAGKSAERHLAVLNLAAEKAGWGQPLADGWSRGVAVHESFGSVVANVCEVKVVDGEPKVRRVVVAVDCGVAVTPDQVRAQMEGGTNYGLSAALFGQITLKGGAPVETNFDAYRVLRHNEAPKIETYILPSARPPSGVGEPGTPVIMASLPNAILAATGKPVSRFPIVGG